MKVASEAWDMRMALGEGRKRGGDGGWIGNHGAPCEMMRDGPESRCVTVTHFSGFFSENILWEKRADFECVVL